MEQSFATKGRFFLVGCPRSGTTLLQSLLAAHPNITSFPETHFFSRVVSRNPVRRILGLASIDAEEQFKKILLNLDFDSLNQQQASWLKMRFIKQYTKAFLAVLDALALDRGTSIWLEKTPIHLHYIKIIENLVEDAKFIHILRNGFDVIASLYEVTHNYPQDWGGARNIDQCINRWISDVRISIKNANKSNHLLVSYEQLISNSQGSLAKICQFIGVDFTQNMLKDYPRVVGTLKQKNEHWKLLNEGELKDTCFQKFNKVFNKAQKAYISQKIEAIKLTGFTDSGDFTKDN